MRSNPETPHRNRLRSDVRVMKQDAFLEIDDEDQKVQQICNYLKHQNPKYTFELNGQTTYTRTVKIGAMQAVEVPHYSILVKLKGKVVEEIISYSPRWDEIHSTLFPKFERDVTTRRDELQLHTDHLISDPNAKETFKQMYGFNLPERVPKIGQLVVFEPPGHRNWADRGPFLYMGPLKFRNAKYYSKPRKDGDAANLEHRFDAFCLTEGMKTRYYDRFRTAVETLFRKKMHVIESDPVYAKVWDRISKGWMVTPSRAFALRCYVAKPPKDALAYYREYVTQYMKLPEVKSAMRLGFTDVWNPTIPPLSLDKTELKYMLLYLPMLKVTSVTEWKRQTCDICMGTKSARSIIHEHLKPPSTLGRRGRSKTDKRGMSSSRKVSKTDKHAEDKRGTGSSRKASKTDKRKTDKRKTDKRKTDKHKTDKRKTDKHKTDKHKTDKHRKDTHTH